MAYLVGYRHSLTRVPSGEGGMSTPKWGGGGGGNSVLAPLRTSLVIREQIN